jgi:glycerol-3-phosphate dehydrogenase
MSKQIAIIGAGAGKTAIAEALAKNNDVVIMTPEEAKEAVYQYHASPMIKYANEEKKFICKGKHQYTNINGEWICQCGRKTTD